MGAEASELLAETEPLIGTTIAGRFTIVGRLGRGSMGAVYRARQEAVGRDVALKLVRSDRAHEPETKARFEREARAISSLVSPHTVTAFDFGEAEDGSWFLAMEMLEGETVGQRLRRVGHLPWTDAVAAARGALKSLAEAHEKGIIHRDLKPDNLFLASTPGSATQTVCKVLDFGIAKWLRDDDSKVDQLETQAGTVFGTPRYMSPEQAQGATLDARSDLYSLGVLLFQMLCGRPPFVDDDAVVVMASHIKDAPPRFSEVAPELVIPEAIESVVRRALAKSPDERPSTAADFIAELDAAQLKIPIDESGVRASAAPAPRGSRGISRLTWLFALLALALLSVAVVLAARVRATASRPQPAALTPAVVAAAAAPIVSGALGVPTAPVASSDGVSDTQGAQTALTSTAENSASVVPSPASATPTHKAASPARSAKPGLSKKANERYGRFE